MLQAPEALHLAEESLDRGARAPFGVDPAQDDLSPPREVVRHERAGGIAGVQLALEGERAIQRALQVRT
ncbi:MAG: hypothetical protein IPJ56_15775 [Gemmatimonadetes bacterium]|nr:hypothetical protein [Gemmatimonadota bacterium]